jgi:hypothetical protein
MFRLLFVFRLFQIEKSETNKIVSIIAEIVFVNNTGTSPGEAQALIDRHGKLHHKGSVDREVGTDAAQALVNSHAQVYHKAVVDNWQLEVQVQHNFVDRHVQLQCSTEALVDS